MATGQALSDRLTRTRLDRDEGYRLLDLRVAATALADAEGKAER